MAKHGLQYIPRNMHTVLALLCFVVVIHWLIFPYPSGLLHWHCGNLTIAPEPGKQPWWIWINTSCEFIMNDCITTTKQSTIKPCAYFLGYTVLMPVDWLNKLKWWPCRKTTPSRHTLDICTANTHSPVFDWYQDASVLINMLKRIFMMKTIVSSTKLPAIILSTGAFD